MHPRCTQDPTWMILLCQIRIRAVMLSGARFKIMGHGCKAGCRVIPEQDSQCLKQPSLPGRLIVKSWGIHRLVAVLWHSTSDGIKPDTKVWWQRPGPRGPQGVLHLVWLIAVISTPNSFVISILHNEIALSRPDLVPNLHRRNRRSCFTCGGVHDEGTRLAIF